MTAERWRRSAGGLQRLRAGSARVYQRPVARHPGVVENALDSGDHDVDYFYASRLPGEGPKGVEDIHYHIFEPRALRASVRYSF